MLFVFKRSYLVEDFKVFLHSPGGYLFKRCSPRVMTRVVAKGALLPRGCCQERPLLSCIEMAHEIIIRLTWGSSVFMTSFWPVGFLWR